jgi:hypothetical protein
VVFLLLGAGLMIAGAMRREPATVFAATALFAMSAVLAAVDLLTRR